MRTFALIFQGLNYFTFALFILYLVIIFGTYTFGSLLLFITNYIILVSFPLLSITSLILTIGFWNKSNTLLRTLLITSIVLNLISWPSAVLESGFRSHIGLPDLVAYALVVICIATLVQNNKNAKQCIEISERENEAE